MVTTPDPFTIANQLLQSGNLPAAEATYRQIIQLQPHIAAAHSGLASALLPQGKLGEAVACCLHALELNPNLPGACKILGQALADQGHFDVALHYHQRAIQLAPSDPEATINLGVTLLSLGELEAGLDCFRQVLERHPDHAATFNNLLSGLQYGPGVTLSELADAHREFDRRLALPLRPGTPQAASPKSSASQQHARDPQSLLRIGFVSPDFRNHPVSDFLIRAFENLDRDRVTTACYYDHRADDERTARFKTASTLWRDVVDMDDQSLAAQIQADQIDILFDLAGHTANNRLLVFARHPAPIQITWIGYEGTTGLSAMDYILADRYEIPLEFQRHYAERVLRMPDSYVCYEPPENAPAVAPLPALARGYITFGCFNNPKKINPQVIDLWANILRQLPTARLVLKYNGIDDPASVRRLRSKFAAASIDPTRLSLLGYSPYGEHLADYHAVDIALDPFPFNGGVTTCEALWMGVPVMTCPGETYASRHSLSYLSSIGQTAMIADTLKEYVPLALQFARDLPRLATLRAGLRQQMSTAPLCDGRRFAANLMTILTDVWQQHSQ